MTPSGLDRGKGVNGSVVVDILNRSPSLPLGNYILNIHSDRAESQRLDFILHFFYDHNDQYYTIPMISVGGSGGRGQTQLIYSEYLLYKFRIGMEEGIFSGVKLTICATSIILNPTNGSARNAAFFY